jgi:geranylgeranyl reductase family protein
MKRIAVLGGGPAGAQTAACLARAGLKTVLIDEKLAWEKPCGGGVTYKAYSQYPFLRDNEVGKKVVHQTVLAAPNAGRAQMDLEQPLLIYSRLDLNNLMLERADRAGAEVEKTRVLEISRRDRGWRIRTRNGSLDADFCIVATGARNPLRQTGTCWQAADSMSALGYYVPSDQPHIDIQFLPGLAGYIWVFPRQGHLSAGICGKGEPAQALRARLEKYLDERGVPWRGAQFYAHMLPALDATSWKGNRVAGDGWLAVGDAGGLVDPITGEGLYYAIRSGDLASQIILNDAHSPEAKPAAYRALVDTDFMRDLYLGSLLARRVFTGKVLFESIPARMVQFVRRSPRFRAVMQDLFAGTQNYETLRQRLFGSLNGRLQEILFHTLFRNLQAEPAK